MKRLYSRLARRPDAGRARRRRRPVVEKTLLRDLMPDLQSAHGYVLDKVESFAVDAGGTAYIITDNDGVDDSSGETRVPGARPVAFQLSETHREAGRFGRPASLIHRGVPHRRRGNTVLTRRL